MKIDVSAEAAAVAAKFDSHWSGVIRFVVAHPRMSVLIAYGAGVVGGLILAAVF